MKGIVTMSIKEANRIGIITKLSHKEIKQAKAASSLGISVRQVRRLLKRFRKDGASGIVHGLRGTRSNNLSDPKVLETALATIRGRYPDFSVTLAHEKLVTHHNFLYSRETLRAAMIDTGLWKPKRQPIPIIHLVRERRPSFGELVQIDGSPHAWFEDRGPYCSLLVYIDDATSRLLWLEFAQSETTNAYFLATKHYLEKYGKPLAFYSDKHGVFRINTSRKSTSSVDDSNGLTQFGRAMSELSIEIIFANSPQAKGRVERVNQTLQDRLVKEMRLRGISTMEEANRYLPEFMEEFNQRFGVVPRSPVNSHRPLLSTDRLDDILVQKHVRVLSKHLTVSYQNQVYQIKTDRPSYAMRQAKVVVREDPEGKVAIVYQNTSLGYQIITRLPRTAVVDSKHINQTIDDVLRKKIPVKPAPNHPWRQYTNVGNHQTQPLPLPLVTT